MKKVFVRICGVFVVEWLTKGHRESAFKITEGLPSNARILESRYDHASDELVLLFEVPGEQREGDLPETIVIVAELT